MSKYFIKRGDIFYIQKIGVHGSEQQAGRPAIIVSNDQGNGTSATVCVVYLTTQYKKPLDTHVKIISTGQTSTALCEQVTAISVERVLSYCCTVSEDEMRRVEKAICIALDLKVDEPSTQFLQPETVPEPVVEEKPNHEILLLTHELELYKRLYGELLHSVTKGG